jgi:hypothetical protein
MWVGFMVVPGCCVVFSGKLMFQRSKEELMDVSTGLASFAALSDLVGLLVNERDRQKAAAIQIEFTNKLLEAQTHLTQLQGTVIEQQRLVATLEQRVRDMAARETEKARYVLAKVGTEREFFAYALRPAAELEERCDEVAHFLCQPCFDADKKVVLIGNGDGYWECPVCKTHAMTGPAAAQGGGATRRSRSSILDGY